MFHSSFSSIAYLSNTIKLTAFSIVLIVMLLSVPHQSPDQQVLHLIKKVPNIRCRTTSRYRLYLTRRYCWEIRRKSQTTTHCRGKSVTSGSLDVISVVGHSQGRDAVSGHSFIQAGYTAFSPD